MSFEFSDSFDHYTTNAELVQKWTSVDGATLTILAAAGRNGTSALRNTESVDRIVSKTLTNKVTRILGAALIINNAPTASFFPYGEFRDSSTAQVGWYVNADSTISIRRNGPTGTVLATSTNALPTGSYVYIEFKATVDNAGTYELRVNGSSTGWIPSASGDTQQSANAYSNVIAFKVMRSNQCYFDDVYSCNSDGSSNNDFLGDVRIAAIFPNAIGTYSEFTPSAGDNYTCVDETTPNSDTDYVSTSGVGNVDTYGFQDLPVSSGTILAIQSNLYARKDDAGSRSISAALYYNSTLYSGSLESLGDTYAYYLEVFETNPNTGDNWTVSEVNNTEFGEKLEA